MFVSLGNILDTLALNIGKVFWLTMDDIAVLNRCGTDVAISVCMVGVKSLRITRYENQLNISTV